MQLVMVHGSGQNELTYHYQTEAFANSDAVNLPGHPEGARTASADMGLLRGRPTRVTLHSCCSGTRWAARSPLDYALRFPETWRDWC